jgi:hypothetical protein
VPEIVEGNEDYGSEVDARHCHYLAGAVELVNGGIIPRK